MDLLFDNEIKQTISIYSNKFIARDFQNKHTCFPITLSPSRDTAALASGIHPCLLMLVRDNEALGLGGLESVRGGSGHEHDDTEDKDGEHDQGRESSHPCSLTEEGEVLIYSC